MGGSIIVAVDWNGSGKKDRRMNSMNSFEQMEAVIAQRRAEPQEGSYTCYLLDVYKRQLHGCGITLTGIGRRSDAWTKWTRR